ncbi:MAG: hypothetical protein QM765_03080 [Myxococcales bacterium]
MEYLPAIGSSLLVHGPIYLTMLVGIVLAIVRWDRHPRTSLFAVVSLMGSLLLSVAGTVIGIALPMSLHQRGVSVAQVGIYLAAWSGVLSLLQAGCWGLLLVALFGPRGTPKPASAS